MRRRGIPLFWLLHLGGWVAAGALLIVVRAGLVPLEFMLGIKAVFVALGILVTWGLRYVYRRLFRAGLELPTLVAASVVGSGLAAVLWTILYNLFLAAVVPRFLKMTYPVATVRDLLDGAVQHTFMILAWSILYFGIKYYQRLRIEREQTLQAEADLQRAELQTLRYQLNPHFLFNALNSISTLLHRDPDTASQMIAGLSGVLRGTLEGSSESTRPLEEELEFLQRYLAIEQLRFGPRLQVRFDVPDDLAQAQVPTLILQPLVENAIQHAISLREEGGRITIQARRAGHDLLRIRVHDDGPETVNERPRNGISSGIGLSNTRSRLRHMYGDASRFELRKCDDGGTTAVMEFPLRSSSYVV